MMAGVADGRAVPACRALRECRCSIKRSLQRLAKHLPSIRRRGKPKRCKVTSEPSEQGVCQAQGNGSPQFFRPEGPWGYPWLHATDSEPPYSLAFERAIRRGSVDVALGRFGLSDRPDEIVAPFELKGPTTRNLDVIMPGAAAARCSRPGTMPLMHRDHGGSWCRTVSRSASMVSGADAKPTNYSI